MKKINKILCLLMLAILAFPMLDSCKKGDGDPFISLRSRAGRLKGEWNLTSGTETGTYGSTSYTATYNGTTATVTYGNQTSSYAHTEKAEYLKDNTFKSTILDDTDLTTCEGFWAFMDGYDQVANKECLVLRLKSQTSGGTIQTWTGDDMPVIIYRINRLSNSEAIMEANGTTVGSSTNTSTLTKTYAKK